MKKFLIFAAFITIATLCGCRSTYNANRALPNTNTVIFTRPTKYTPFFGTYSISDFVEIVYEKASRNAAGQLVVEIGIHYRGPVRWTNWYKKAPRLLHLKTRCNFHSEGLTSPVIYSTNTQNIVIGLGETYAFRAVCPNINANQYQVVLGD